MLATNMSIFQLNPDVFKFGILIGVYDLEEVCKITVIYICFLVVEIL